MGFFDSIGTALDRIVPTVIGFASGGPIGAATAAQGVERAKRNKDIMERNMIYTQEGPSTRGFQNSGSPMLAGTSSPGFFAPGGTLRTGLQDFGGFLSDFAPVAGVFGLGDRFQNVPPSGAQTINFQAPAETSQSGEILGANLGLAPALFQGARNFLRTPGGQTALGFGGAAVGAALMDGGNGAPRITRRMKSDVRKIYMMAGMDPNATAQILNNLGTYPRMNFNASLVFFILTKRFRNDGPVVTKAAVRKTKTTLRRMKGVVDMYNSVCKPTAPRRRAAPSRAKAVQLISNK